MARQVLVLEVAHQNVLHCARRPQEALRHYQQLLQPPLQLRDLRCSQASHFKYQGIFQRVALPCYLPITFNAWCFYGPNHNKHRLQNKHRVPRNVLSANSTTCVVSRASHMT